MWVGVEYLGGWGCGGGDGDRGGLDQATRNRARGVGLGKKGSHRTERGGGGGRGKRIRKLIG